MARAREHAPDVTRVMGVACPVCESAVRTWRTVNDYSIRRCDSCGYAFVNPRPDREAMADFYRTHGGHGDNTLVSLDAVLQRERDFPNTVLDARRILGRATAIVGGPGTVLDVGCGYGLFSREALHRGHKVVPVEVAPVERAHASALLGLQPLDTQFEDLPDDAGPFDVIVMSQVLEHAVDPHAWMAKASQLLSPGGVLCVAVPNFNSIARRVLGHRDPFVTPPEHLNYFGPQNLPRLAQRAGLTTRQIQTISRLPPEMLSKRVKRFPPLARRLLELAVIHGQRPLLFLCDELQLGLFLNLYAVKPGGRPR